MFHKIETPFPEEPFQNRKDPSRQKDQETGDKDFPGRNMLYVQVICQYKRQSSDTQKQ